MAEEKRVRFMSVELAIKRELAYRQKIANLFPDAKCLEDLLPLEVPSSRAIQSPISSSSPSRRPSAIANASSESLFPDPSNQQITSPSKVSESHAATSIETPKAMLLPNHVQSTTSQPRPEYGPTFTHSGRKKNADHFNSGFLPPQQQLIVNLSEGSVGEHYCRICEVHCLGANCFNLHLRGQKHNAKLQQLSADSSVEERNKQVPSSRAIQSPNSTSSPLIGPSAIANASAESLFPDLSNQQPSLYPSFPPVTRQSLITSLSEVPQHHVSTPSETPNAVLLPNHVQTMTFQPRPAFRPTFTHSGRKRNAEYINSWFQPPQEKHIANINEGAVGEYYCRICQVPCLGSHCFNLHLRGQKHNAKLQQQQLSGKSSVEERNKQVRCDLCEICCPDENALLMHLKGQKHNAKHQEMECGKKIKNEHNQRFWCELCQVTCMNEETLALHLRGKNHIKRLYDLEEEEKEKA